MSNLGDEGPLTLGASWDRLEKQMDTLLEEIRELEEQQRDGLLQAKEKRQRRWPWIKLKVEEARNEFITSKNNLNTIQTMRRARGAANSELDSEDLRRLETLEQKLSAVEDKVKPKRWWRRLWK